jgi:hypothetical protein
LTLADAEDNTTQQERLLRKDSPVLASNEDSDTWPPWPWPPWEGDGDGDEDEDDGGSKRGNKTLRAHELAEKIVKFERKLAQASLDLCAFNMLIPKHLTNWHLQRHFVSRSNRNVQSCSFVQSHGNSPSDSFPYIFLCVHSRLSG